MESTLVKFNAARHALAEARSIDEVKDIRDKAEALRLYVKQQGHGLIMQNDIAEIKIRAERRVGELLQEMEKAPAGRPKPSHNQSHDSTDCIPTLSDLGISRNQSSRWQSVASIPQKTFEQHITEVKEKPDKELTSAGVQRLAQKVKREKMVAEKKESPPLPDDKYRILYVDPPWQYGNKGLDEYGHAERHYPTMSIPDLCAMGSDIKELMEKDAVLFLWVTSPLLEDAFKIIGAWGFKYKTSFVWDKVKHNFGHYNSVRHEFLLVCTKGSCTPDVQKLFDSVQVVERSKKHSEKPKEFREIIDTLYTYGKRLELFARTAADSWEIWGNEPEIV